MIQIKAFVEIISYFMNSNIQINVRVSYVISPRKINIWDDDISTAILGETGEIFLLLYLAVSLLFEAIIKL